MNHKLYRILTITGLLTSSLATNHAYAGCGQQSPTITNLPNQAVFQVNALGASGDLTGFFYSDSQPTHAYRYSGGEVTDLGAFSGDLSEGFAINAHSQIVGDGMLSDFSFHALGSDGTNIVDLGTLGGSYSSAFAINDAGQVAGESYLSEDAVLDAFRYDHGVMIDLGNLGGGYSSPSAINGNGSVVGYSTLTNNDQHGFLYSAGTLIDLGTLGGNYSAAYAINDAGLVAGEASNTNGDTHGFVYAAGVMTDLGTLGGSSSSAHGVNQSGQVIGSASTTNDVATHGFIYSNSIMTDLGTLGGPNSFPSAINNAGQIVGSADTGSGSTHAFLWQNGTMMDLNAVAPQGSGWELTGAQFINDAGRIVGSGLLNGASQPFILDLSTPNHAPVALAGADTQVECGSVVLLDASQSSDPDGNPVSYQWIAGGFVLGTNNTLSTSFPLGTNVVTLVVTDPCGAYAQTNVTVTVVDTTAPMIVGLPVLAPVSANGNCEAVVPNITAQVIATDSCSSTSGLTISQNPAAGTPVGLGQNSITVTARDAAGNSSSKAITFSVVDTTAPVILSAPTPVSVSVGSDCQGTVPNVLPSIAAVDSCTPANQLILSQAPSAGTVLAKGSYVITVTVTDAAGNHTSQAIPLTLIDTTAPVILSAATPRTVSVGANCQGVVPNVLSSILAADNCTAPNQLVLSQQPAAGTMLAKGSYVITVTVTDAAGNHTSQAIPLTMVDTTAPVIQTLSVNPSVLSTPNHKMVPVTVSATATDNCDSAPSLQIVSITSNETVSAGEIEITGQLTASLAASRNGGGGGRVYTITVRATDASGNSSTRTVTVTVPQGNGK